LYTQQANRNTSEDEPRNIEFQGKASAIVNPPPTSGTIAIDSTWYAKARTVGTAMV
jgi:hypothetical protein